MALNKHKLGVNKDAFYELLRAGLWESEALLAPYDGIDYAALMEIAEEQSVVGLITAGLDKVCDVKVPQGSTLQFIGRTLQVEQRNKDMNVFIEQLVSKMQGAGIHTLLVKGQGVAQCYERPLWRVCGDVDLFLSDENYERAKKYLIPLASQVEPENVHKKHLGLTIDSWLVELHGYLRCRLSQRINSMLDEIKDETFGEDKTRTWKNGNTQILMLSVDNDILYVFTHFLSHFYGGGIGLRQICDWSRLIWTYRGKLDRTLLEKRLKKMGAVSEWKSFASFAVEYLGIPSDAMPLYSPDAKWKLKANKINSFIMEVGNFGHNRDNTYYDKPYLIRKVISYGRRCGDFIRHARIFPMDSIVFFFGITKTGVKAVISQAS